MTSVSLLIAIVLISTLKSEVEKSDTDRRNDALLLAGVSVILRINNSFLQVKLYFINENVYNKNSLIIIQVIQINSINS